MRPIRAWSVRVASLLVTMLATIGGVEVYRGLVPRGHADPDAVLDHFVCYNTLGIPNPRRLVEIKNQFTDLINPVQGQFGRVTLSSRADGGEGPPLLVAQLCVPSVKFDRGPIPRRAPR